MEGEKHGRGMGTAWERHDMCELVFGEFGLYYIDLKHSLKMALRCRNMSEIDICHKLFYLCIV
jgi:hypothetical protein